MFTRNISIKRSISNSCIIWSIRIGSQSLISDGCIVRSSIIVRKCLISDSNILTTSIIRKKCLISICNIMTSCCIPIQCLISICGIIISYCIILKRTGSVTSIIPASSPWNTRCNYTSSRPGSETILIRGEYFIESWRTTRDLHLSYHFEFGIWRTSADSHIPSNRIYTISSQRYWEACTDLGSISSRTNNIIKSRKNTSSGTCCSDHTPEILTKHSFGSIGLCNKRDEWSWSDNSIESISDFEREHREEVMDNIISTDLLYHIYPTSVKYWTLF